MSIQGDSKRLRVCIGSQLDKSIIAERGINRLIILRGSENKRRAAHIIESHENQPVLRVNRKVVDVVCRKSS